MASFEGAGAPDPRREAQRDRDARLVEGGESVCWLDRVCPECGRLTGELLDGEACRACSPRPEEDGPAR